MGGEIGSKAAKRLWDALVASHVAVYRRTNGRVFSRIGRFPFLLLTTRGRKSGKKHTIPIGYLKDGDAYVIVASAGGSPTHPAWYLNLSAEPSVTVQIKDQVFEASAETVDAEERARLWPRLVELYPDFEKYQARAGREIPIVMLAPKQG